MPGIATIATELYRICCVFGVCLLLVYAIRRLIGLIHSGSVLSVFIASHITCIALSPDFSLLVSAPITVSSIIARTDPSINDSMFSVGRVLASRVAVRAVNTSLFTGVRQAQIVRTFAASTFLDPAEVAGRITDVIKAFDKVDANKVTDGAKFTDDLGLDSLDAVEVVMAIEDEFAIEIPDAEADKIASVADAVEYITSHPMAK